MNIALKLKISNDPDVLLTIQQYTKALNFVSQSAFAKGDVCNPVRLHKSYYSEIRERFNLPSQMSCSVFRDIARMYKMNKRKLKKAISFKESHLNVIFNRDFNFKNGVLSLTTVNGRKKFKINAPKYYQNILGQSTRFCDSTISKDRKGQLYFNLVVVTPEKELTQNGNTMGIDLGLSKLAVASTNSSKTLVINGGSVKDKRLKFLRLRQKLQRKGTHSAKRLLKKISGRETRYMRDVNYCVVKKVINFAKENNVSHIGIEDLSGIRNSRLRKEQRRQLNSWAFYQFRIFLEYKAKLDGLNVIAVNPRYTSQACSKCGHTERANRKTQKLFVCKSCGFSQNADINASANIEFLTRLIRSNVLGRAAINQPDATSDDAKGLFSHLRRSLVANPPL